MRRGGALVLAALIWLTACVGPRQAAAPPAAADTSPVTVRVAHVASPLFAPLYVALDRGYFARLNVTVELHPLRLGQDPVTVLALGQVDVALLQLGAPVFNGLGRGLEFAVVGSMGEVPADGSTAVALEVARPLVDSGDVRTAADLKGRAIAVQGGAAGAHGYLADQVLRRAGIGLEDLTVVDLAVADMETAMRANGVAAALAVAPVTARMEREGTAVAMGAPRPGTAEGGVLFGAKFGGSAAGRFFEGLVRGARDVQGASRTSAANLAVLSRYVGQPAETPSSGPLYEWDRDLRPDPAELTAMQAAYRRLGQLRYGGDLPDSRYVDGSYAKRAADRLR